MRVDAAESDADTAVSGHKLNRVRNQIPHNLLQSYWIAKHRSGAEIERNVHSELFCFCCRPQRFHRGVYHRGQIHGLGIKAQFARDDARHVEHVVDQTSLKLCVPVDGLESLCSGWLIECARSEKARPRSEEHTSELQSQ